MKQEMMEKGKITTQKKAWTGLISFLLLSMLSGCGSPKNNNRAGKSPADVNSVMEKEMAEEDQKKNAGKDTDATEEVTTEKNTAEKETTEPGTIAATSEATTEETVTETKVLEPATEEKQTEDVEENSSVGTLEMDIDVDLTKMSSTMVYSEVYNMITSPSDYLGKVIKMKGNFGFFLDESTGNRYFACVVQDATACCAQGIEFTLTDNYVYPDDYPEPETEFTVVGIFDTYEENGYYYITLRNGELINE